MAGIHYHSLDDVKYVRNLRSTLSGVALRTVPRIVGDLATIVMLMCLVLDDEIVETTDGQNYI